MKHIDIFEAFLSMADAFAGLVLPRLPETKSSELLRASQALPKTKSLKKINEIRWKWYRKSLEVVEFWMKLLLNSMNLNVTWMSFS